jgi:outer membrane protein OmpA-like peptidoglycan-associated protein
LNADKQDFISTRASVNTEGIKREDKDRTISVTIYVDSIALDEHFRMENVFYDYDKASLRPESGAELEKLITLMRDNPSLDVEIGAHTDSKGDDAYNMNLSQQRAEAVVQYLISSGIERSRLTAKGYGETKPVAPNTVNGKDSPENRAKNRRTEFRILADVPSRRLIFDSSKPGTIGQQERNLQVTEEQSDNVEGSDSESEFGRPGSRVRGE